MPIQYQFYSMKKMAAFSRKALFALLTFFCAYLLLHVDGAPSSAGPKVNEESVDLLKCYHCDESFKVEKGKNQRQSMIEHLDSCKKFNEQEEEELKEDVRFFKIFHIHKN
jgi:hypothetical protein